MLSTLSAVQILVMLDAVTDDDRASAMTIVQAMQQPDGSFQGDKCVAASCP